MKKVKVNKEYHTSDSKKGMGDYYGSGIRNKVGRIRENFISDVIAPVKLKKAPKSLA